jgi:hypothetical protein
VISRGVDVREAIDVVVDSVIERVMAVWGRVILTDSGSMKQHARIVLVPTPLG